MQRLIVLSTILLGLALPAYARPIEPEIIPPTQLQVRDEQDPDQGDTSEGRPVLLPLPVAGQVEEIAPPAPAARSRETKPPRRLLVIPWQSGVFQ